MKRAMTRRELLRDLSIGAGVLALAGCQPKVVEIEKTVEVERTVAVEVEVEKVVKETVVVEKTAETTKIVFWPRGATDEAVFVRMLPLARERYPEIDIVLDTPPEAMYDKLRVAMAGGVPPDSTVMNAPTGVPMIGEGLFLSLQPFLERDGDVAGDIEDYFAKPSVTTYTYEDNLYCVPLTSESQVLWYNLDAIEEAGLTPPREMENDPDQWNWDTLVEYALALTEGKGRDRQRFGLVSIGIQEGWGSLAVANGAKFFSDDGTKWVLNSPEGKEALQLSSDLIHVHDVHPTMDTIIDPYSVELRTMFQTGQLAMLTHGEYFRRDLWGARMPSDGIPFRYDLALHPFSPKREQGIVYHTLGVPIIGQSQYPDETWKWLKVIASQEAQQMVTDGWGSRGADERTYAPWLERNADGGPEGLNYDAIIRSDAIGTPFPVSPHVSYTAILETTDRVVGDLVLMDKMSVDEGLVTMEEEINQKIETSMRERGLL